MARHSDRGIELTYDFSYMVTFEGHLNQLDPSKSSQYVTSFRCVVPLTPDEFQPGTYVVPYKDHMVTVRLIEVSGSSEDSFVQIGERQWAMNLSAEDWPPAQPMIPFRACTDNRGNYPCFYAELLFPYLVADWFDPEHEAGIRTDFDQEATSIYGPPRSVEKSKALLVLNKLFVSDAYPKTLKSLEYDDVTAFLLAYFFRSDPRWIYRAVWALASRYAYRDAVRDYFIGQDGFSQISSTLDDIAPEVQQRSLTSELALFKLVLHVVEKVVKHHVEDRRWVQPFWEGSRTVRIDGQEVGIPAEPKTEPSIQPTIHVLLHETLARFGVQVVRESHEGIGSLDFRCLYTTPDRRPLSVSIEFKLAHHPEIEKGLARQLPAYLRANNSRYGLYLVMWFKDTDEKFFDKPRQCTRAEMSQWLEEVAARVSREENRHIETHLLDASIRPSASKL